CSRHLAHSHQTQNVHVYATIALTVWTANLMKIAFPVPPPVCGAPAHMTQPSTSAARKPLLDQQSFQQLLQAAYVLQEHNDQIHMAAGSNGDATRGLLEIVEIQRAIENQEVDAASALRLIAARALNLTGAS